MMNGRGLLHRGALIVVEGIDRSGKSTQCNLLVKALQDSGHSAKLMKFPDRSTVIGKMIDSYLKCGCELDDHAIHLLFSANRWEAVQSMKDDLVGGTTLVIDRYAYSGVAYSSAKPGMTMKWCKQSDVGLPRPDLVMFLHLPTEEAQRRSGYGCERYEQTEFQKTVYENFEKLSDGWQLVDASGAVEDVNHKMTGLAKAAIESVEGKEIKKLWEEDSKLFLV